VLLARGLLSSTEHDVAHRIEEVKQALPVALVAAVSDGQHSIRNAFGLVHRAAKIPDNPDPPPGSKEDLDVHPDGGSGRDLS
jgi:hypothetical protein